MSADDISRCTICGEPMPPGEQMFKFHGYSGPCPAPPLPRNIITKDDAAKFTFREYRKIGTTKLSDETLPAGTKVRTLEGELTCPELSRIAIDVDGNIYAIAESVVRKAYEVAATETQEEK